MIPQPMPLPPTIKLSHYGSFNYPFHQLHPLSLICYTINRDEGFSDSPCFTRFNPISSLQIQPATMASTHISFFLWFEVQTLFSGGGGVSYVSGIIYIWYGVRNIGDSWGQSNVNYVVRAPKAASKASKEAIKMWTENGFSKYSIGVSL